MVPSKAAMRASHSGACAAGKLPSELEEHVVRASVTASNAISYCLEPADNFVERFGYFRGSPPKLTLRVGGHHEENGCTLYSILCSLQLPSPEQGSPLVWTCRSRLCELREGLHDPVKRALGSEYATFFGGTPFSHHAGPPGTTARLAAWAETLAGLCENVAVFGVETLALVLRFFGAPEVLKKVTQKVTQEDAARSGHVFTFKATLVPGLPGDLGMTYVQEELLPSVVVVSWIREGGAAAAWNSEQTSKKREQLRLRHGDRVVASGVLPREEALAGHPAAVAITVQRWQERYQIQLKRKSATDKLGMKLELFERACGEQDVKRMIRVSEVSAGLLDAWNTKAVAAGRPHEVVTPGTEILRVGEITNPPEDMLTALQEGDVDMTVRRPELARIESMAAGRGGAFAPFPGL